ncbi:MAG TPA: rhodanese-like domain-containing protein [Nocardioidaceae bacterium]|nr:rhodanese-like domain-containing protein [Nocardioidaceae bacterium]
MNYGDVPSVDVSQLPEPLPADLQVLDVREPVEWDHGHIAGARLVPLAQLPERLAEISPGRTLVVCKVGGRSAQATAFLTAHGYDAVNLDGGMVDWADAGRPMVSESGGTPQVV